MGSNLLKHRPISSVDPNANVPTFDQSVTLEEWNPRWLERFRVEAERLESAGLRGLVRVDHIGSTAVKGMAAKPIIDIALSLSVRPQTPRVIRIIEDLGYRYLGTYGLRGRHFYRCGQPAQLHLHVIGARSPHLLAWLDFCQALNEVPEFFTHYLQEKRRLAEIYANDRAGYTAAKGPVISSILASYRQRKAATLA